MKRILVVDDDPQSVCLLQSLLQGHGCQVETATNGREALDRAHADPPDLVISDILMPVMDGFALCREWKSDPALQASPFVFYTATYTDPRDEELALSLGAARFILKPADPQEFMEIIRHVIDEAEAGALASPRGSIAGEEVYLRLYNERLVKKLEDKMLQLERANRRLASLYSVTNGFSALRALDRLVPDALHAVVDAMDFSNASYFAYDPEQQEFHLVAAVGFPEELAERFREELVFRLGEPRGLVGLVGETRRPLIVEDAQLDPRWITLDGTLRSALFVPVIRSGALLGVMNFLSTAPAAFDEQDARNASTLANNLSVVLENVELMENLSRSEARFRRLAENAQDLIYRYRLLPTPGFVYVNSAATAMTGYTQEEHYADPGLNRKLVHPADRPLLESYLHGKSEFGKPLVLRWIRKDGNVIWTEQRNVPVYDEAGNLEALEGIVRDVTEQVEASEALQTSEERYRVLFESVPATCWTFDREGTILSWNRACEELYGWTAAEAIGRTMFDLMVRPENAAVTRRNIDLLFQGEAIQGLVLKHRQADGFTCNVLANQYPVRDAAGRVVMGICAQLDASEQVRAEEKARHRAAQLEALNAIIAAALAAPDLFGLLQSVLDRTLEALGIEIGLVWMLPHSVARGLPEEAARTIPDITREVLPSRWDTQATEDWQQVAAGDRLGTMAAQMIRWGVRASLTVPIVADSAVIGGLGLASAQPRAWPAEEIALLEAVGRQLAGAAERLRLLSEIEERSRQLLQILRSVPEGVLLLNADYRVLEANPAARELLALLAGVAVGETLVRLGGRPLVELLTSPQEGLWHELAVIGPPRRLFESLAQPIESGPVPKGWVLVVREVTQERATRVRANQQERLAAVGQLAAGIAHDFSNIMAVIVLYSQMTLREPTLAPHLGERMAIIHQQARRASDLIQQVLDFSRASVVERRLLDLEPFVKEIVKLLERTLPENIEISLAVGSDEYTVQADPTRIQQVLMNLALNARDAMPDGGRLWIQLRRLELQAKQPPPIPGMAPGEWIEMAVADNGTGVPAEVVPHLFEPFFTTKERGKGSGLGLAQVYGIVEQHQGHIDVDSQPGAGTAFRIYLPALRVAAGGQQDVAGMEYMGGQGETVLVVEDNPQARAALVSALQALNYRTLAAGDGGEAMLLYQQHRREIALVLSDWVMPGMGGKALLRALRVLDPTVKVVITSGHPLEDEAERLRAEGAVAWINKPPDLQKLAQTLSQALQIGRSQPSGPAPAGGSGRG